MVGIGPHLMNGKAYKPGVTIDTDKYSKNVALGKLRRLLRKLGLRSIKSDLEYSMRLIMSSIEEDTFGRADQVYISPSAYRGLSKVLSTEED